MTTHHPRPSWQIWFVGPLHIYIWQPPPQKNVSCKNSGIYCVSRTFCPLDFGSFFWGGTIYTVNNTTKNWHAMKRLSKSNYTVVPALSCNSTEKLKTESIWRISLGEKQFFSFSGFPQIFWNSSRTEKLKNWIHMENLFLDLSGKNNSSVYQFWFWNYSGNFP